MREDLSRIQRVDIEHWHILASGRVLVKPRDANFASTQDFEVGRIQIVEVDGIQIKGRVLRRD